jgi:hypothetical protein
MARGDIDGGEIDGGEAAAATAASSEAAAAAAAAATEAEGSSVSFTAEQLSGGGGDEGSDASAVGGGEKDDAGSSQDESDGFGKNAATAGLASGLAVMGGAIAASGGVDPAGMVEMATAAGELSNIANAAPNVAVGRCTLTPPDP